MADNTSIRAPIIQPMKLREYETKQSKCPVVPQILFKSVILGPSGFGKTILLQNMILDIYRNCFARIYIFSPSIDVDATWNPVKLYIEKEMKVHNTKEELNYFDHYDPEALEHIIKTQHRVIEFQKKQDHRKLFSSLIVVDDMADNPVFTKQRKLLHQSYTRCRHTP